MMDYKLIFSLSRLGAEVSMQIQANSYDSAIALGEAIACNMEGSNYYCQKNSRDIDTFWSVYAEEIQK